MICKFAIRRWLAAALVAAPALTLAACGSGGESPPAASPPPAAAPSTGNSAMAPAATTPAATAPTAAAQEGEYRLGPGDSVQVAVFGQPDLTGKYDVDANGNLVLPLAGPIRAAGRPVSAVQAEAIDKLNAFLVNPKVSIQVLNYRPFYILGQVMKPGSYPYAVGLTVRQAVAIAGGFTPRAKNNEVKITRMSENNGAPTVHPTDDPVLPGDTIEVDRRLF